MIEMSLLCDDGEIGLASCLQSLVASRVHLGAEISGSCARSREVASEDRLDEGAEDNLRATNMQSVSIQHLV